MAKKVKSEWLGGRVDEELKEEVGEYIDAASLSLGELLRLAVVEYIKNNPIKESE